MLKDIKPRIYQEKIFHTTTSNNSLVVIPTGLGKTVIAIMLAAFRLEHYNKSKILILAPTKPLVEQHYNSFKKHLDISKEKIHIFTGSIKPEKREELWKDAKIVISTPQGMKNDIITNKTPLEDVSLMVFDEAHRTVKDYAYVFIAEQYQKRGKYVRILGLTASPGSDKAQIEEVCQNLGVEKIEIRTEKDDDIKPYVQDVDIKWVEVPFPDKFQKIKNQLEGVQKRKLKEVKEKGYLYGSPNNYTKKALLGLQAELRGKISSGEKDYDILKSISLLAEVMKAHHALELLESQGLEPLEKYFSKLETQAQTSSVKAVKNLVNDSGFIMAKHLTKEMIEKGIEHPKLEVMRSIIKNNISENKKTKIILFTQYRSTASNMKNELDKLGLKSEVFIGQARKERKGLTQKEQKEMIESFSKGEFNCLISTSVGEEGLDIPQVDIVMFYEPIPSAIRTIQRRGRTGRLEKGKVLVLMTKNTRDEAYRWAAYHKEKRMYRNLEKLRRDISGLEIKKERKEKTLDKFTQQKTNLKITADHREKHSSIIKKLVNKEINIELKSLEVADYLLSDNVAVEYKTKRDFVDSIVDGRLLQQIKSLVKYPRPLLIIQGEEDLYSMRNIHANAIRGMLSTIAISYRIPIIFTQNDAETADLFEVIAKREQEETSKNFQMHTAKPLTLKEQQEYIISSLPGVGGALSKPLLEKFGSVKKIINASKEDLKKVDLIGDKKATRIKEIIDSKYHPSK